MLNAEAEKDPLPFSGALRWTGYMMGLALGGFFDGILLHQLLQWHHLLSGLEQTRLDILVLVFGDGTFLIRDKQIEAFVAIAAVNGKILTSYASGQSWAVDMSADGNPLGLYRHDDYWQATRPHKESDGCPPPGIINADSCSREPRTVGPKLARRSSVLVIIPSGRCQCSSYETSACM